jgi:cytidylate kinase
MSIITIARQLGAGGAEVADRLSDALGWRLLDRALVERIATDLNVTPDQVEAQAERVESFVERLGMYLSEGYPQSLPVLEWVSAEQTARAAKRVVTAVVDEGPAVIVGHGAQCVLRDDRRAFHVLVYGSEPARIERAARRYEVDPEEAARRIRASDADRTRYIRENFGREWLNPTLYHLCIDTGRVGIPEAARLIQSAVERYFATGVDG